MKTLKEKLQYNHKRGEIILSTVSGVATTKPELVRLFDKNITAVDIITTKSFQVTPNNGNREPIVCSPSAGNFGNSVGLRNPGMDAAYPELLAIREDGMRAYLNVSVSASNPEDFITLIKRFDSIADSIELNFSCPHAAAGFGASIGSDINIARSYVEKIVAETKNRRALLIIKLTPNVDNIGAIAKAVIDAGADGVAAINTVGPKLYLEKNSGLPILNNKVGGKGGASGEWVRERAIECIREIRAAIGDEPIILGMGGVTRGEDAKAMIEAGADSVGIGSALSRVEPSKWNTYFKHIKNGEAVDSLLLNENILEYKKHKVVSVAFPEKDIMLLELDGALDCKPGEFAFLFVPGKGEKPFSIARNKPLTFLIKRRGQFTADLFELKTGDDIFLRGLYGKSIELKYSRNVLLLAGGSGVAVLPLLAERLAPLGVSLDIRVGVVNKSNGKDPLEDVLETYGSYMSVADEGKPGRVLDTLTDATLKEDLKAYIVGPGKMMEAAAKRLTSLGLSSDDIYMSMEKNTMCGIGMCGECVCAGKLPCKEGTFFTYSELLKNGVSL